MAKKNPDPRKIKDELTLEPLPIKKAALLLRAVNHPFRQEILRLIQREGPIGVTALYQRLRTIQPVASAHLAILRKAEVVITRREGKYVLYRINEDRIAHLDQCVTQLFKNP